MYLKTYLNFKPLFFLISLNCVFIKINIQINKKINKYKTVMMQKGIL